ncbi:MAG: hypothetical protein ACOWYE_03270 [Desulfatiglandales bacterium]
MDAFAVTAALGSQRLGKVFWAGFKGIAFTNPLFRYFSRISRTVPVDPARGVISSMAFGAAVPAGRISIAFGRPLDAGELDHKGQGKEKRERIASALHEEVSRLGKSVPTTYRG